MSTWLVQYLGCLIPPFHEHLAGDLQLIPAFHEHLAGAVPGVSAADPSIS